MWPVERRFPYLLCPMQLQYFSIFPTLVTIVAEARLRVGAAPTQVDHSLHIMLHFLHSMLHSLHSMLHSLHSISTQHLHTACSILYTASPHSMLHSLHSILHSLYSMLHSLHSMLHSLQPLSHILLAVDQTHLHHLCVPGPIAILSASIRCRV